jgi:hypothetical protein
MPEHTEVNLRDLDYRGDERFMALVEAIESENATAVDNEHRRDITLLRSGMDCLYAMVSQHTWVFNAPSIAIQNKATTVLFSTLHKNLIALHTSLKLTRLGLYGPARSILRHVYESLLIAKFCSVSHDTSLYEKWKEGNSVYLSNGILKKICSPDIAPFSEFWGLLSDYSHATVYAQQVHLNVRSVPDEVPLNLVYLRILLDCLSHLVGSHLITPSMRYYTKRYRGGPDLLPALRAELQQILSESRSTLLEQPRAIIRNYRATWKLA